MQLVQLIEILKKVHIALHMSVFALVSHRLVANNKTQECLASEALYLVGN